MNTSLPSTGSTYDVTNTPTVKEQHGSDFEPEWSQWVNPTVYQALLPATGAVFIVLVIFVISCCLIKKKKKISDEWRKKSVHTIESNDGPECGIYDVIDEVKSGLSLHQEIAPHLRCDRIIPNHLQAGNTEGGCKTPSSDIFVTSSSSFAHVTPRNYNITGRHNGQLATSTASSNQNVAVLACQPFQFANFTSSQEEEEDRIYETLDKNWKLKYEEEKLKSTASARNSFRNGKEQNFQNPGKSQNLSWTHNSINGTTIQGIPCECAHTKESDKTVPEIPREPGKLVCQISLFEVSEDANSLQAKEATYFYMFQPENTPESEPTFGNSKLQVFPFKNMPLQIASLLPQDNIAGNRYGKFVLEPVKGPQNFDTKNTAKEEKTNAKCSKANPLSRKASFKNYDQIRKASTKVRPSFLLKKSESFKDSACSPAQSAPNLQRRRSESCSSGSKPRPVVRQFEMTPETARIISKLGPLPPVPSFSIPRVQGGLSKEKINATPTTERSSNCHVISPYPIISVDSTNTKDDGKSNISPLCSLANRKEMNSYQMETKGTPSHTYHSTKKDANSTGGKASQNINTFSQKSEISSNKNPPQRQYLQVENPRYRRQSTYSDALGSTDTLGSETGQQAATSAAVNHYFILEDKQNVRHSRCSNITALSVNSDEGET